MKITTYEKAVSYLESFIGKIIFKVSSKNSDPLERMRIFLELLGNPQNDFKSVLVGGTSGKGSTSYLISHILTKAEYKTGFTLSPHLQKVNERIQINGKSISDSEFVKLTASMIHIIKVMEKMDVGAPSYFEILVGMAFLYFSKEKVDIAVVEVGMGGEFDATNTLNPLIAIITNVGLDHTNVLGNTVEKIAKTKAGIIKDGAQVAHKNFINSPRLIVITGAKQASVIKIIEERSRKVGAKLYRLGKDFELTKLKIGLLGDYQKENASIAMETIRKLKKFGFDVSENVIKKSLPTAFFPGRFEIIKFRIHNSEFIIILDGAHNPTKMKAFLESFKKLYPKEKKIFVVGFKNDKEIGKMLKQIAKVADTIIATEFKAKTDMSANAAFDASKLKSQISKLNFKGEALSYKDSSKALKKALDIQRSQEDSVVIVTGSLYLVGEVRGEIKNEYI